MNRKTIFEFFKGKGLSDFGIIGLMCNIYWESGFNPKNLENTGNKALNMTDDEYTAAVDSGLYSRDSFQYDSHGFGLAQWTWHSRKLSLFNYAKKRGVSIGNIQMQLDFLWNELQGYKEVLEVLRNAKSIREASDIVMLKYERPADQSEKARAKRASYGETLYNEFYGTFKKVTVECRVLQKTANGAPVGALQAILNAKGFDCGAIDNSFGGQTDAAVRAFQKARGLEIDGCVGSATWTELLN